MLWIWIGFIVFVLALLALDLGVFHRKDHVVKTKEALAWSAVWIGIALLFSVFVYFGYERHWMGMGLAPDPIDGGALDGRGALIKYVTGYVIEKSLSVDNIFVIVMVFSYFAVPAVYQHRVLFWGILGAIAMRGAMIYAASWLVTIHWVIWVFGGFLILTGLRMMTAKDAHGGDPGKTWVARSLRRLLPVTDEYHGKQFFARVNGRTMLTPLALALAVVEATDLVFAVDSIPAIFAITGDPFLVFTSNIFAILGLRSLYFALAGMMDKFRYLKLALSVVLVVVGVKMLAATWLKGVMGEHFNLYLLGVVFAILGAGVGASLRANRRDRVHAGTELGKHSDSSAVPNSHAKPNALTAPRT